MIRRLALKQREADRDQRLETRLLCLSVTLGHHMTETKTVWFEIGRAIMDFWFSSLFSVANM